MEQPFSTSKVTVEYFDPHGLYKLLGPGIVSRLPLRHLHWQSHSGPLRSIETLHVELVSASSNPKTTPPAHTKQDSNTPSIATPDDGFQTATVSGRPTSIDSTSTTTKQPSTAAAASAPAAGPRRHQIPGLRRTPYLKLLLVRCDDNDAYKAQTRSEIKDWVKQNTAVKKSAAVAENHDAFEWMIVHVVLPNSAAYAQPRTSKASTDGSTPDLTKTSRWGKSSSTIFERLRSDFNTLSAINAPSPKTPVDRVAQIRIGLEDVPYEMLPRTAAPAPTAAPGGHAETEREAQSAWADLIDKFKTLILSSFDVRVSQYEEDIREKDVQRSLPGWNFCTFFILKEGLARGFESVGLVEDALVGYDELSVGLDTVIKEQQGTGSSPATHGGSLLGFTEDLKAAARRAINNSVAGSDDDDNEDTVDLQATAKPPAAIANDEIPISSMKKPYRDLILANNVSVFDFRCYIFARQISLLLRLGNAWSSREELLAKLKEQQDAAMPGPIPSVTHSSHLAVPAPPAGGDDTENLSMLAEICRRALEFVPAVSQVMREDLLLALASDEEEKDNSNAKLDANALRVIDNMVASFAFSIAQQILAQTSTRSLPIPPSSLLLSDPHAPEPKASIPEPKTMMHPARMSSLGQPPAPARGPPPLSPGIFPSAQGAIVTEAEKSKFLKAGLEDLAARRADLHMLSRSILQRGGQLRGWSDGWSSAPLLNEPSDDEGMEDVSLDDDEHDNEDKPKIGDVSAEETAITVAPTAGIENLLLRTALESTTGFYRLYEVLTDKCLRHFTVASHPHAVNASLADLAVLKFFLGEHAAAAAYFYEATAFFGDNSWSLLELSMLHMYATSLKALGRTDEYAWRLVRFLARAAAAEGDAKRVSAQGCLVDLLEASTNVSMEMRVPLTSFFSLLELDGPPVYHDGQDSFSVTVRLASLLVDTLPADSIRVRMVQKQQSQTTALGPPREIWLESRGAMPLKPGKSTAQLFCNTIVAGVYEIDQVRIKSKNLVLFHDREVSQAKTTKAHTTAIAAAAAAKTSPKIFADPHVVLYQRTEGLDIKLSTSRDLQLDKNNFLELSLLSGWNDVKSCEIKIRAATGGLRLTTSESKIVSSPGGKERTFAKPVGAGIVCFNDISAGEAVTISFPFSIEQDALELCLKIEVTYTTKDGTFVFAKQPTVSTALALGVNVQDVFKHSALFSRFTVSTATASPLQVCKSELLDSEYFTSEYGSDDNNKPLPFVYPKQPISLLYKIVRKAGSISVGHKTSDPRKTTMYIKLHYNVFQDQLDAALVSTLAAAFALEGNASVSPFSKVASAAVLRHVHAALTPYDLERTALLGELATRPLLGHVNWVKEFPGLGSSTAEQLAGVVNGWLAKNAVLVLPNLEGGDAAKLMRTILIPVDIPSITVVHTADIQLQPSALAVAVETFGKEQGEYEEGDDDATENEDSDSDESDDSDNDSAISVSVPIFCVNQLLPATLHLKWTRIWDTLDDTQEPRSGVSSIKKAVSRSKKYSDMEFAFEVSAPTEAWLIGGRRKGHFVIPAPDGDAVGLSSTADSEATIALMLIPLREGRLPYPSVEIREVQPYEPGQESSQQRDDEFVQQHHETDYRNLGETVAVVADRKSVTLSLDASGPGGGPLVLVSERAKMPGRELI